MSTIYDPGSVADRSSLATAIRSILLVAGFKLVNHDSRDGEVWKRSTPNSAFTLVVLTGIIDGLVAPKGGQAIRVFTSYLNQAKRDRVVTDWFRIMRTGTMEGICERMLGQARNAFLQGAHCQRCGDCGAPTFRSRKGNRVCAELCWAQPEDGTKALETEKDGGK